MKLQILFLLASCVSTALHSSKPSLQLEELPIDDDMETQLREQQLLRGQASSHPNSRPGSRPPSRFATPKATPPPSNTPADIAPLTLEPAAASTVPTAGSRPNVPTPGTSPSAATILSNLH